MAVTGSVQQQIPHADIPYTLQPSTLAPEKDEHDVILRNLSRRRLFRLPNNSFA